MSRTSPPSSRDNGEDDPALTGRPSPATGGRLSRVVGGRLPPALKDRALRSAGGLVAVAGAVVTAAVEVNLAMLRIGTVRIPVAPLVAVAANLALVWFAYQATGRRWAVTLPAATWVVVMVLAGRRTSEGDMLLTGDNWVGQVMVFVGAVAFGLGAYHLIVSRPPGTARPSTARPSTARDR